MGCAPSIHVSHTGVVYCTENEESPTSNHQPPPPTHNTTNASQKGPSAGQSVSLPPQHGRGSTQAWGRFFPMQGENGHLRLGPMKVVAHQHKVLLVFGREDNVSEAWWTACKRQGHDVALTRNAADTLRAFTDHSHDLIIIDARSSKHLHAENVCKSIRGSDQSHFTVIIGIVKKSFADRENATVGPLLKIGFNRIVTEVSTVGAVLNDLIQIEHCDLANQSQLKAMQAVFTALDSCKEVVHITDTQHRIQYVNRTCENLLGYVLDDVLGRSLWELHTSDNNKPESKFYDHRPSVDFKTSLELQKSSIDNRPLSDHRQSIDHKPSDILKNAKCVTVMVAAKHAQNLVNLDISEAVNMQMRRGREWEGLVTCRRKSGDIIHMPSKVIPVAPFARKNEYYVYTSDTPAADRLDYVPSVDHFHPRGSIKSLRKGSYDIRSLNSDGTQNITRRQSLVKLHSLTIEAPITRVFNIITAAQENSPAYVAQALERVLEILRSTELYSPQLISSMPDNIKQSTADPVATDLLGGLLAHGPKPLLSGRRSSSDTASKYTQLPRPSLPVLQQQASAAIREVLAEDLTWNFDVIKLEKITDKRPLVWIGMNVMCKFDVPNLLGCDEQTIQNWLTLIEANYHPDNTYHNSTHAADVLQSTAYFLNQDRVKQLLDPLDVAACLIAAVVHDVDHPGKNSAFLCNTDNELAILYNDLSVLESHHAAVSFKHTHSDERVNIYKALDRDTYKHIRKSIIDMVLATDMTKHFEHLSKFVNMAASNKTPVKDDDAASLDGMRDSPDLMSFGSPENVVIIKRMLIKCADVSNPVRPLHLAIDWAHRIANEYFSQTEEEKKIGLPIVMPQFDRTTCSIPKSQIGFIDFFITDMFDAWDALADVPELMNLLRRNYQYWKEQEETAKNGGSMCLPMTNEEGEEKEEEEEEGEEAEADITEEEDDEKTEAS